MLRKYKLLHFIFCVVIKMISRGGGVDIICQVKIKNNKLPSIWAEEDVSLIKGGAQLACV